MAKNSAIILAAIIAVAYFLSAPGVVFTFPESNVMSKSNPGELNKVNLAVHAAVFGLALAFALPVISGIIG